MDKPGTFETIKLGFWQGAGQALFLTVAFLALSVLAAAVARPEPQQPVSRPANERKGCVNCGP